MTPRPPIIYVSGPAGVGKSLLARRLSQIFDFSTLEVGVVLRLLALLASSSRMPEDVLWRWSRAGRIAFDGSAALGLASVTPRFDGRAFERSLWSDVCPLAVAELAANPRLGDVLSEVAAQGIADGARVIVGREPQQIAGVKGTEIHLTATPAVRNQRKAQQLARIGVFHGTAYDPPDQRLDVVGPMALQIDTTDLSAAAVSFVALGHVAAIVRGAVDRAA